MSKSQSKPILVERTKIQLRVNTRNGEILPTKKICKFIEDTRTYFTDHNIFSIEEIDGKITIPSNEFDILKGYANHSGFYLESL